MTTEEADEILNKIEQLKTQIMNDEELRSIDERYAITADWIDTDIDNVDV